MKYILIVLSILFLLAFAGIQWINWSARQPCPPPNKSTNVPTEAVWKGGCDGGSWIQLIEMKEKNQIYDLP